jgi:hypothetical protein
MAQQFYKKPASMGGGSNTFTGWDQDWVDNTGLDSTANGTYGIASAPQTVTITGSPHALDYDWTVSTVVTPSAIETEIIIP